MVEKKDIAIAVIGGASSIAAILLVFMGFLIAKAESLPEGTPDAVIARYRITGKAGLIPLLAFVFIVLDAYCWFYYPSSECLFRVWSVGFPVATAVFMAYSIWSVVVV